MQLQRHYSQVSCDSFSFSSSGDIPITISSLGVEDDFGIKTLCLVSSTSFMASSLSFYSSCIYGITQKNIIFWQKNICQVKDDKLEHRSKCYIFLGYPLALKDYKVWYQNFKTKIDKDIIFNKELLLQRDKKKVAKDIELTEQEVLIIKHSPHLKNLSLPLYLQNMKMRRKHNLPRSPQQFYPWLVSLWTTFEPKKCECHHLCIHY